MTAGRGLAPVAVADDKVKTKAVGLADNRDKVANSPYLTKVGDAMPRIAPHPSAREV